MSILMSKENPNGYKLEDLAAAVREEIRAKNDALEQLQHENEELKRQASELRGRNHQLSAKLERIQWSVVNIQDNVSTGNVVSAAEQAMHIVTEQPNSSLVALNLLAENQLQEAYNTGYLDGIIEHKNGASNDLDYYIEVAEQAAQQYVKSTGGIEVLFETPQQSLADQHPDDEAVHAFACQMKDKLAIARSKGRGGWDNPDVCGAEDLARMLLSHLTKRNQGNYLDVANFCMMLHQRGESPSVLSKALAEREAEMINSLKFPVMLRKMWSGGDVQEWLKTQAKQIKEQSDEQL